MSSEYAVQPFRLADGASFELAPYPVVLLSAAGELAELNRAGRALFAEAESPHPELLPDWLAEARARALELHTGDVAARVAADVRMGERSFDVHATRQDDGAVRLWLVDNTDTRLANEAVRVERGRMGLLSKVSTALLTSLNLERCMEITVGLAAEHLADAAVVLAPGNRHGHPVASCARGEAPAYQRLPVDSNEVPGLSEALQGFPPVPSRWIDPVLAPEWMVPAGFGPVGSIVVTPLPGQGVPAGALVLLRRAQEQVFTEDEEGFARLFAARAGSAIATARLFAQQTSITDTLMRELLPPVLHKVDGIEFAGRYRPSLDTERVGGDFYDVHPATTATTESLAVLGDVCGKGLEAAVLTGKVRNTLQALLPLADHKRILDLLNGALLNSHHTRFVTLALASVHREGASVHLRLTCAGHLPPLVVRNNGAVEVIPTCGTLVGVLPEIDATTAAVDLAPGETCLLYTDGITEAKGGPLGTEMFGEQRLYTALAGCAGMPAEAVVEHIQMLAAQWVGASAHDDMATLAITAPRTCGAS